MDRYRFLERLMGTLSILSVIVVFVGIATVWYEYYAVSSWPLSPDPAHGIIVPFNNHGVIHYISRSLSLWLDVTFWSFFPCFLWIAGRARLAKNGDDNPTNR
jgi:hypothetical protein